MWELVAAAVLILSAASMIPLGAWMITRSRLPHWMRGALKWPIGDNLSTEVAYWSGWAAALAGAGALVLLIPLLRLPARDITSRAGLAVAVLLMLVSIAAYVRGVVLSYRAPATPLGPVPIAAMRRDTALAVGLVAGLALGALVTAGLYDAFPGATSSRNQAAPLPPADGLHLADVELGTGTAAAAGKLLTIRYTVWLGDGTRIDSSTDRATPFTFTMDKGEVIKGLDEGVVGMRVGGIRWLTIPAPLAYGASGATGTPGPGIPPNATLVMVVELLAVGP